MESGSTGDQTTDDQSESTDDKSGSTEDRRHSGSIRQDSGLPTAPSIGPHTHIEHVPPEERLAGHEPSETDAMGKDKRRSVVGGTYGPTRTRIFATFGTAIAIIVALVIGFILLAKSLDQPPDSNPDKAPWSAPDSPQHPPPELQ
jgi:hypothetical protein